MFETPFSLLALPGPFVESSVFFLRRFTEADLLLFPTMIRFDRVRVRVRAKACLG